jgi:soluble lytic murein transglycosylase
MILKRFWLLGAALALSVLPALASDKAFLYAHDAYRAGDAIGFAKHAKKLQGHVLAPWVDYWRLAMRLEDTPASDVRRFLSEHGDTYVGDRLRGDWLKLLGKRGEWQEFDREAALFRSDDLEIRCYGWASRLSRGDGRALAEAASMWLEPRALPEGCARLAEKLLARGDISLTDIWQRVRVLFENGQTTAAKTALDYLPENESPDEHALLEAARWPKRLIARLPNLERRAAREVAVLAVLRYARDDPPAAAEALERVLAERLPEPDVKYLWSRIAYEAARKHHERALKWFAAASDARLNDEQLAWKVRAALRAGHWHVVREAIERMSPAARADAAWIYWYGRALAAQGDKMRSRAAYLRIAGQREFYGLLATEELGYIVTLPAASHVPSEEEIEKAKREPGLARALELIRLGLRTEGVREWQFTIRSFDDVQLIAAAELARRAEVYDRAISTADRTVRLHNFSLRYLVPFDDVFREHTKTHGVDQAWVLALVRQESRFIAASRSSAGATGIMQIMPDTARYVAEKIRLRDFQPKSVGQVQTNVTLGTGYLKILLERLGHPVLASAAYNAGPSRARRWLDVRPLEGAIYAETIPIGETREYVKKVMKNAVYYAAVHDKRLTSLKASLGTVSAGSRTEPPLDEALPLNAMKFDSALLTAARPTSGRRCGLAPSDC